MNGIVAWLAAAALISGIIAAWYWYKATRVRFEPEFDQLPIDAPEMDVAWKLIRAIMISVTKAGRLNRRAALWTAVSVVLGGASALFGAFTSN
jgi:hypothetical protein